MDDRTSDDTTSEFVSDEEDLVPMPDLPTSLMVETEQQYKAIADKMRWRILGIIQNRPATAKQIATRLGIAPGTARHHLQVLESAGLAQIVATRIVHGIVAKYYTRTARIFTFKTPPDMQGEQDLNVDILGDAHEELLESLAAYPDEGWQCNQSFPHVRLSEERAQYYEKRIGNLVEEILSEPTLQDGVVYGFGLAMFRSPPYMQDAQDGEKSARGAETKPDEE